MASNGPIGSVRQLEPSDLPAFMAIQQTVVDGLPLGYIRAKPDAEVIGYLLGTAGVAFGVFESETLLAVSLLELPNSAQPNTSLPFRLVPPSEWQLHSCFLESTMVVASARGRGFQRSLLDVRIAKARQARMKWACSGVHVDNSRSWRNLLATGFVIADYREDRGYPALGLLRSLEGRLQSYDLSDVRYVVATDARGHQKALTDGYIGIDGGEDNEVRYARLSRAGA